MKKFAHFLNDESGATAIEYALLSGLLAVGVIAAATTFSEAIEGIATNLKTYITGLEFGATSG